MNLNSLWEDILDLFVTYSVITRKEAEALRYDAALRYKVTELLGTLYNDGYRDGYEDSKAQLGEDY